MKSFITFITTIIIMAFGGGVLKAQQAAGLTGTGQYFGGVTEVEQEDSTPVKRKTIALEVAATANSSVFIENISRKVIIKTWNENKVKIEALINYRGEARYTDQEWFDQLNIHLKATNNNVVISAAATGNITSGFSGQITYGGSPTKKTTSLFSSSGSGVSGDKNKELSALDAARFDGDGNWVNRKAGIGRTVTVYIPAASRVDVESVYADIIAENNLKQLSVEIKNANLVLQDVDDLNLQSLYCNVHVENVKDARIELVNGRLVGKKFDKLDIDTKSSTVELGSVREVDITSVNDQYEIDEVGDVKGRKDHGNLRITSLKNTFDVTGTNADIKIRSIESTASLIKIDGKYADIRLPVNNLKNFTVDFDGKFSSVYTPFEKTILESTGDKGEKGEKGGKEEKTTTSTTVTTTGKGNKLNTVSQYPGGYTYTTYGSGGNFGEGTDGKFKAVVGDAKGKVTAFKLTCVNCTVDFK